MKGLYGRVPKQSVNDAAGYFDQTQIADLQRQAVAEGKKYVILFVFDGMDWQTTRAAAIAHSGKIYGEGRGAGLAFLDYRGTATDYGFFVTSPTSAGAAFDVNRQRVKSLKEPFGGYDARAGGAFPWSRPASPRYLIAQGDPKHAYVDSAASATAMTCGKKSYNGAINVGPQGKQLEPIARRLQRERQFRVGVVTSVPISHATPAAAYANNVTRNDYQDLTRDLLGLPSIAHREPLPGVDVLLGAGWGVEKKRDGAQGINFIPGNRYLAAPDLARIDQASGGRYTVVVREAGVRGAESLRSAVRQAVADNTRLMGFFGVSTGHLPFQTADGKYNPVRDVREAEVYRPADIRENPTLADLTEAALAVLGRDKRPFWLMVEAGDVDWANHANNIDSSIGAVRSGDEAFRRIVAWVESRNAWDETAIIVTADHGHLFFLTDPSVLLHP